MLHHYRFNLQHIGHNLVSPLRQQKTFILKHKDISKLCIKFSHQIQKGPQNDALYEYSLVFDQGVTVDEGRNNVHFDVT